MTTFVPPAEAGQQIKLSTPAWRCATCKLWLRKITQKTGKVEGYCDHAAMGFGYKNIVTDENDTCSFHQAKEKAP